MKGASLRVLLVEDDPISREVLAHAIAALPAQVAAVASLAEARTAITQGHFDAWMVDAHLPDGAGSELLGASPAPTVAIAHTAAHDPRTREALMAAGFHDVLVKPLSAAQVQSALRSTLQTRRATCSSPSLVAVDAVHVWDDAAALLALGGSAANVAGLRGLFVRELEPALPRLHDAFDAGDHARLHDELHRLKASCGFVGAAQLAHAVQAAARDPACAQAHAALHAAAHATLQTPYPPAA